MSSEARGQETGSQEAKIVTGCGLVEAPTPISDSSPVSALGPSVVGRSRLRLPGRNFVTLEALILAGHFPIG